MIFVDQPVNTGEFFLDRAAGSWMARRAGDKPALTNGAAWFAGFSYSSDDRDRCYDERCVSDDMVRA